MEGNSEMMTPDKLSKRLAEDTRRTITDDDARRQVYFRWILKFLVLFVMLAALINFLGQNYSMAIITAVLAGSYYIDYWFVHELKNKGTYIVSALMIIKVLVIYTYVMVNGTANAFSTVWILLLPPISMLLMGKKIGTICSAATFLYLIVILWSPIGDRILHFEYSMFVKTRLPLLYLLMFVITFFSETLRLDTVKALNESREQMANVYQREYTNLRERIAEAKRVRHDTRHHFVLISSYLNDGRIEEAKTYIERYYNALPFEESLTYCEHYGTNALLTYFAQQAKAFEIPNTIKVSIPAEVPITDDDLTVVFGNLLENALDASREGMKKKADFRPFISVLGRAEGENLLFSVENEAVARAETDTYGHYISTKHEGNGIGIESVQAIAEKHGGIVNIKQEDGKFIAKVNLPLHLFT